MSWRRAVASAARRPAAPIPVGVFALLALTATLVVYWPVSACFFHDDDFVHLYRGVNASWWDLVTTQWGGHMIAVFTVAVALLLKVFGPSAGAFYILLLLTHLAAVGLLFAVVQRLTADARAAGIAALLFGTTPVHVETLGWFSVYGQVIATVTMLLAVLVLVAGDDSARRPRAWIAVAALLLTGALAYGVGIAVALAFPIAAWLLLTAGRARRRMILAAAITDVSIVGIYHLTLGSDGLPGLTRALLAHAGPLAIAVAENIVQLLANGVSRLLVGGWAAGPTLSLAVLAGVSAAWSLLVLAALARASSARRRQIAAFLVLAVATYGMVAIGRSITLAIWGGADMGSIKRYHYAASAALAVVSGLSVSAVASKWRALILDAVFAALIIGAMASSRITARQISSHASGRAETARVLSAIERTAALAPPGATVHVPNQRFGPAGPVIAGGFPGWAAVFAIWSPSNRIGGRTIVFVESDPKTVAAAATGYRSAGLVVGPTGADANGEAPSADTAPR